MNKNKLFEIIKQNKIYSFYFLVAGVSALLLQFILHKSEPQTLHQITEEIANVDTFIPAGFVLAPIEVENSEALDALIGDHGMVNLYSSSLDPTVKPQLVAKNVKIIRSPTQAKQYAVLAPENESGQILRYGGRFFVMVLNPEHKQTEFTKKVKISTRIIHGGE